MKINILKLIVSIIVCQFAGIIGSFFTSSSVSTWYAALKKPGFNPPNWVFGPVWITLFLIIGISLYIVWDKGFDYAGIKIALVFFIIQLILNILWSLLFFGLQSPFLAFMDILFLWAAILVTMVLFFKVSFVAGWLLVPYILWVSFAAVLNGVIWFLNRTW